MSPLGWLGFPPTLALDDVSVDNSLFWGEPVEEIVGVEGRSHVEPRRVSLEEARAGRYVVHAKNTKTLKVHRGGRKEKE